MFGGRFLGAGVERGDGQFVDGLGGGLAELVQAVAGFHGDAHVEFTVGKAFALGQLKAVKRFGAGASGIQLGNFACQHFDRGINLPLQGRFMAQDFVELVQTGVFGKRVVFKELGLPAVQPAKTPTCGSNLFNVVALQKVAGAKLGDKLVLDLLVAAGVFAEGRENNISPAGITAYRGQRRRGSWRCGC